MGQIFEEFVEEKGEACTMDGKNVLETLKPKLEIVVCYGFQA
jgi:hypothetical protein